MPVGRELTEGAEHFEADEGDGEESLWIERSGHNACDGDGEGSGWAGDEQEAGEPRLDEREA